MIKTDKDSLYKIIDWIIPAVFIISIFECYFGLWRLATVMKFVAIAVSIILLYKGYLKRNYQIFKIFFLLSTLSIISYTYNDRPWGCMNSDMFNTIPAMLFFLIGMNDNRGNRRFYDLMMYVCTIVLTIGLACYITTPSWYVARLAEAHNNSAYAAVEYSEEQLLEQLRFSSFFEDSYAVSLFSIYILSISLFNYFRVDSKNKYSLFCTFIALVAAIMCMHRVSIACAFIILLGYAGYGFFNGSGKNILRIIIALVIILVVTSILSDTVRDRIVSLADMLTERTGDMSFSSAYNERQGYSHKLMDQWSYPLFGHGIGSGGPTSRFLGYGGVTDAGYTKLLFENGIVGILFFFLLLGTSILRGLKYFRYLTVELSVICFVALAMTGSNTLSIGYNYILPFWYMLGRLWNRDYLQYSVDNRLKI